MSDTPTFKVQTETFINGASVHQSKFPIDESNNSDTQQQLSACLSLTHKYCNVFFTERCKEEEELAKPKSTLDEKRSKEKRKLNKENSVVDLNEDLDDQESEEQL